MWLTVTLCKLPQIASRECHFSVNKTGSAEMHIDARALRLNPFCNDCLRSLAVAFLQQAHRPAVSSFMIGGHLFLFSRSCRLASFFECHLSLPSSSSP